MSNQQIKEIIALVRAKHQAAEQAGFPHNTKAETKSFEQLVEEFNIEAWNHVPFILDQLESRLTP